MLPGNESDERPENTGWCADKRCRRTCPARPTLIFPRTHRTLFNEILGELDLKTDREGNERTSYSLRHTYISMRLMEGADIYQIAKNCRTSVEMIEKYYASHIKDRLDAAAINVQEAQEAAKATAIPNRLIIARNKLGHWFRRIRAGVRAWRNGRRTGLKPIECPARNRWRRTAQIRGNLQLAIPSQAPDAGKV